MIGQMVRNDHLGSLARETNLYGFLQTRLRFCLLRVVSRSPPAPFPFPSEATVDASELALPPALEAAALARLTLSKACLAIIMLSR